MARISGVDIPREKRLEIALTYIYGLGRTRTKQICEATGINPSTRVTKYTATFTSTSRRTTPLKAGKVIVMGSERGMALPFQHIQRP